MESKAIYTLALLCWFSWSWASDALETQPVFVEAQQLEIDESKGISVYSGNVSFKQGGIALRADRVEIYFQDSILLRVVARGTPVELDYQDPELGATQAQATTMEYVLATAHLTMQGNPQLWQGSNHFSGGKIEFDAKLNRVLASRASAEDQPVRVVIQPVPTPKKTTGDGGETP